MRNEMTNGLMKVQQGVESFAFNLFVLGSIQDNRGKIWKRHPQHLYAVEIMDNVSGGKARFPTRHILNLLPCVECLPPREVLEKYKNQTDGEWIGMDNKEFGSDTFQRPFQYLMKYAKKENLDLFRYTEPVSDPSKCTEVLLNHCCMQNPSWAQMRYFASFLNLQLKNCENSIFCDRSIAGNELSGLKEFAVRFMIRMSQDFATPSLNISDESLSENTSGDEQFQIYQLRRKWEESSHPYVFFNEDKTTMTFINVNINKNGDLLDGSQRITDHAIVSRQLLQALKRQGVSLDINFDTFSRERKLEVLCRVMGIQKVCDPDPTYELTTDNVLKMLAIYMRFRCQIPVIIMGETGCGKTRMIEFMSRLKAGKQKEVKNMITLKIHGGITVSDVHNSVKKAQNLAKINKTSHGLNTILFYDEANTTEAIYAIKEVMCDMTIDGKSFSDSELQLVAACNPYKQLSEEARKKLEDSGLGYRIHTSETAHLFGNIPIRTLVYRVVALPPSMQPFIWDFGQLGQETEGIYIKQMTKKMKEKMKLDEKTLHIVNTVFSEAQIYMRTRNDECRYVSLRDVERCIITYEWFYEHREHIYHLIEDEHKQMNSSSNLHELTDGIRTLLQAVGVCYHASLDDRRKFRQRISHVLKGDGIELSEEDIHKELIAAQAVFLREMNLDDNIACNEALQENVFMMTVCLDMGIPLFLIGKPGSSKSLAKTIVTDNMQGETSRSPLYKRLKQVHILSYQCSALTDAAGIEGVFKQCAQLQMKQNLKSYTAAAVLDEIGLAEDSPNMPLKVLHPLLECGSTVNGSLTEFGSNKKVGFVGISNWALDPAKMNRGIFVTRNKPSKDDLKKTAQGIFKNETSEISKNHDLLDALTETYLEIYNEQQVEYFGLRDYYSLMKMIHAISKNTKEVVKFKDVWNAIQRNFSGAKKSHLFTFMSKLKDLYPDSEMFTVPLKTMIQENLSESESRFLLLLTNQFSAASLLQICIDDFDKRVQVVFGSSFPGDHNYTDICKNINRIKVCMETGRTVVLLNMTEIHESLYDALNQHYVTLGLQKYVDLGLGGHRVKCRIADDFRLIVIEQKEIVYSEYPIPLINRLEKHFLESRSLLSPEEQEIEKSLSVWVAKLGNVGNDFGRNDAFVGLHDDTISSVVLTTRDADEEKCKEVLLESCAMDAVFRLPESLEDRDTVQEKYLYSQIHDSLLLLLKREVNKASHCKFFEVVSYSNVLSENDRQQIETTLSLPKNCVMLLSLEQFRTEQEYLRKLDEFFKRCQKGDTEGMPCILLIQCSQAQSHAQLIACAKYCLSNKIKEPKVTKMRFIIGFLFSTERLRKKSGSLLLQHTRENKIIYIDDLRPTNTEIAPVSHLHQMSLCQVLEMGRDQISENKDVIVNISSLLKDCVCEAVGKVKSQQSKSERYLARVRILSALFSKNDTVSISFRKLFLQWMINLYKERENQGTMIYSKHWIVAEACNQESLQEGGTFRKTIWLCLKRHVSRMMAYILSNIDTSNNLSLLADQNPEAWKINMWLDMFKVLPLNWDAVGNNQEFTIIESRLQDCLVPFSFVFIDLFNTQWNMLSKQQCENTEKVFLSLFQKHCIHPIAASALDSGKIQKVMGEFSADLVKMMYEPGSTNISEVAVITKVIYELSMKRYMRMRQNQYFKRGDEIAVVFLVFKEMQKHLVILREIFKASPSLINQSDAWLKEQSQSDLFQIHVSQFKCLMDVIKEKATNLESPVACSEWMTLATAAKKIFSNLLDMISMKEERQTLIRTWMPISLLHHLLIQLLPSASHKEIFKKYLSAVASPAKLLWDMSIETTFNSQEFLQVVCSILRMCYEDLRLSLLTSSENLKCKICKKKVKEPTFLPCGDFSCKSCIKPTLISSRRCPICSKSIPDTYEPEPAKINESQAKELGNFKCNCTSFFLVCLDQFCFFTFRDEEPVQMKTQIRFLFENLVVQSQFTKSEGLEQSALDLNFSTRCCILMILLRASPSLVMEMVNELVQKVDRIQLESLTTSILMCFEEKIYLDSSNMDVDDIGRWKNVLSNAWQNLNKNKDSTKADLLHFVAEMRCSLVVFTDILHNKLKGLKSHNEDSFIRCALSIVNHKNTGSVLQDFVVKVACQKYGTEWFYNVIKNDQYKALVPPDLLVIDDKEADYWKILGTEYLHATQELHTSRDDNVRNVVENLLRRDTSVKRMARLLSIITWAHAGNATIKVEDCLRTSTDAQTPFFQFLIKLEKQFLPNLRAIQGITDHQTHMLYQLVTMVVGTVTSGGQMMDGFRRMASKPSSVMDEYLPGMPETTSFLTINVKGKTEETQWYKCPNGHPYVIGDCKRPWVKDECPQCKATIGGSLHKPAEGNQKVVMDEKSDIGYQLNKENQPNVVNAAHRITAQGGAVVQFILHACMLVGLQNDEATISGILGANRYQARKYLVEQLNRNLDALSQALGRNMDHAVMILYRILLRIANHKELEKKGCDWRSMENRKLWEETFRDEYLRPVFQNLDNEIMLGQKRIEEADDLSGSRLFKLRRIINDGARSGALSGTDLRWNDPKLWVYIRHSTSEHLLQVLSDSQKGEILQIILETPELHFVQFLETVLLVQSALIQKYQSKIDIKKAEEWTLAGFLKATNYAYEDQVDSCYIKIWNMVFPKILAKFPGMKKLDEYFQPMNLSSPISMGIPSTRGRGQCAKLLAEYLTDIQNDFLISCKTVLECDEVNEVKVPELTHSHFVCVDKQRDLLPLIQMHKKYDIKTNEQGRHHHIAYNIDALEKQVREKFVMSKKLIAKETLPCLRYPQDIGIGSDWEKVLENAPQQTISAKISQDMDRIIARVQSADICEGVRTLTHAIPFLVQIKTNVKRYLCEFLENDLLISSTRTTAIPRSAQIEHTLSLYSRLSWHKAVNFALCGLNPYKHVLNTDNQVEITDDILLRKLDDAFLHSDVILLQQRLNEVIIKVPDFNDDWSLPMQVFPYYDFMDDSKDNTWYARLPEEICFKHIAHLFSLAVTYKN